MCEGKGRRGRGEGKGRGREKGGKEGFWEMKAKVHRQQLGTKSA